MPIRVQDELPAVNFLRDENVFVMTTSRATGQEIRPLKVLILNLMPKKIETENQFLRLLSNSPLQVDIQLQRIDARESRNTPTEHLNNFYCNFDEICNRSWSGPKIMSPRRCLSVGRYRPLSIFSMASLSRPAKTNSPAFMNTTSPNPMRC